MVNKAYEFCKSSVRKKTTPKYVKLQMRDFMRISEGKDKKYIISEKKVKQVENILKILNMPKGLKAGQSLFECTTGYQWHCIVQPHNSSSYFVEDIEFLLPGQL